MSPSTRPVSLLAVTAMLSLFGCAKNDVKYQPRPAPKVQASLPAVPNVPQTPIKRGDVYTVWGAGYTLRSRVLHKNIGDKPIIIEGYIVDTNLAQAPACAVHKGGKADPENCKPPVPTFWLADTKEAPRTDAIQVMGWASNYAQLFDAMKRNRREGRQGRTTGYVLGQADPESNPQQGREGSRDRWLLDHLHGCFDGRTSRSNHGRLDLPEDGSSRASTRTCNPPGRRT
ncbi:MAG: hypothetical protein QM784_01765 [Polyangiaceae bacterium]